jgi:hypothetical protein
MLQEGLPKKKAPPNWALDFLGRIIIGTDSKPFSRKWLIKKIEHLLGR